MSISDLLLSKGYVVHGIKRGTFLFFEEMSIVCAVKNVGIDVKVIKPHC
jgi:GDP-D-mannose dehydratase